MYAQTWFTTENSIENPMKEPLKGIERPVTPPFWSWMLKVVGIAGFGIGGGTRTVGSYAAGKV
jgi:hypothetical protein